MMVIGFFGWIFLSIAVGLYAANHRGRSGLLWFLIAFLISPIIAFILALVLRDLRLRY
jgi:multisubunit Na+/H+ antiporter MnhG subunit